ncbi:hypothetical protein FOXG_19840 [Fusarium oxysporum f. sp. lycopersici 4287]|uniref:Uncharacterized protein n=1 Tax=Fusarium oxysporum f. sp. lycopersici (strain 4287 / CBS 123668 / FGSC 9935 / NRRL 34936) TaxID=426428 RepID=A0A0J9V7D4_FUSO4|nr:hypothetical protein FOXG_19840 [Fusarium oxysporum f. sp. lycopersici 4287]KNB07449.1 hypothetical protein FOXG_19840 [Fusarium oxysporum f. sp. lycopersici 4287]
MGMTAQDQKDSQDRIGSSKGTAFNIVPPSLRPHIHDFGTRWRVHYRQCPPGVPRCCNIEATVPETTCRHFRLVARASSVVYLPGPLLQASSRPSSSRLPFDSPCLQTTSYQNSDLCSVPYI